MRFIFFLFFLLHKEKNENNSLHYSDVRSYFAIEIYHIYLNKQKTVTTAAISHPQKCKLCPQKNQVAKLRKRADKIFMPISVHVFW